MMQVLYNENNYRAKILAEKLAKAKPGQAIPCSPEELDLLYAGKEIVLLSNRAAVGES